MFEMMLPPPEPPSNPLMVEVQAATPLTNPGLCVNLDWPADWSTELPFLDHFRSARAWIGHSSEAGWGGMDESELDLDAQGWLRSLPLDASGEPIEVGTIVLHLPEDYAAAEARYVVLYEGEGEFRYEFKGREIVAESAPGRDVFELVHSGGDFVHIVITETNPDNYLRNIQVIREDQLALHQAGELFNPEWLDRFDDFRGVRLVNWMYHRLALPGDWDERPLLSDAKWTWRGVPYEVMIRLANEAGFDPWITLPVRVTDDHVRQLARMLRRDLDPALKTFIEFNNEVWNWQFEQATYAQENAEARWGADVEAGWMQWYGMRSAQIADILAEEYGADAEDRLVRVLATQAGWPGLETYALEAPDWVAEGNQPPHTRMDALAITAYFTGDLGRNPDIVKGWFDDPDGGFARALRHLSGDTEFDSQDTAADTIRSFAYFRDVADRHDLALIVYEGGTHVVGLDWWDEQTGTFHENTADEALTEFLIALNRQPGMGEIYDDLLNGWRAAGGGHFCHYQSVGAPSRWGSWGALAHLEDDSPRFDAITRFNQQNPGWWENRSPDAFIGTREGAAAALPRFETGWYWNADEPGRGYALEIEGDRGFWAAYLYAPDGEARWYVSTLARSQPDVFAGSLTQYRGGQSLHGTHRDAELLADLGPLSLSATPDGLALTDPGGLRQLTRFPVDPDGGAPGYPETGWWWAEDEPGRGYFIETAGSRLFIGGYMYDAQGDAVWYVSLGEMLDGRTYEGEWLAFANGGALDEPASEADALGGQGAVALSFAAPDRASLTLPDGRTVNLTRFAIP